MDADEDEELCGERLKGPWLWWFVWGLDGGVVEGTEESFARCGLLRGDGDIFDEIGVIFATHACLFIPRLGLGYYGFPSVIVDTLNVFAII